jgi:hypothetical protein
MNTSKHTPGPWCEGGDNINGHGILGPAEATQGFYIALIPDELQAAAANARLISAAPDLLALLEDVAQLWAFGDEHIGERSEYDKAWHERVAVTLAKVAGTPPRKRPPARSPSRTSFFKPVPAGRRTLEPLHTHMSCKHCEQDIENLHPFRNGEWRDRGNNRTCPSGPNEGKAHAPFRG